MQCGFCCIDAEADTASAASSRCRPCRESGSRAYPAADRVASAEDGPTGQAAGTAAAAAFAADGPTGQAQAEAQPGSCTRGAKTVKDKSVGIGVHQTGYKTGGDHQGQNRAAEVCDGVRHPAAESDASHEAVAAEAGASHEADAEAGAAVAPAALGLAAAEEGGRHCQQPTPQPKPQPIADADVAAAYAVVGDLPPGDSQKSPRRL